MTIKKIHFLFLAVLLCGGLLHAEEIEVERNLKIDLDLRLYKAVPAEGAAVFIRWISATPVPAGATYFYTGNVKNDSARSEEAEIKKVFKVRELQSFSRSAVTIAYTPKFIRMKDSEYISGWWEAYYGVNGPLFEAILSDGKSYALRIIPIDLGLESKRFRLQIYEPPIRKADIPASAPSSIYVDVDFTLPAGNTTIIGFADSKNTAYFLSIELKKVEAEDDTRTKIAIAPSTLKSPLGEIVTTPSIKVSRNAVKPDTIKTVAPIYPESCKKNKIQGTVELEVTVDAEGRPENVKILHGIHPDLDKAAVDAVRKWVFKPLLVNGKPKAVVFNLNILFELH